jgi:putative transposase
VHFVKQRRKLLYFVNRNQSQWVHALFELRPKLCSQEVRPTGIALKSLAAKEIDAQQAWPLAERVVEKRSFAGTSGPEQEGGSPFFEYFQYVLGTCNHTPYLYDIYGALVKPIEFEIEAAKLAGSAALPQDLGNSPHDLHVFAAFGTGANIDLERASEYDHVHLLVNYPPKIAVARLVNSLKGVSSRLLRQKKYPSIQKSLWGDTLWSPSYFAGSCGGAPLEMVKKYIQAQDRPSG